MPSDDFMDRADDEREMTPLTEEIDEIVDDVDDVEVDDESTEDDADTVTFASLGLPEEILAAVTDMGFRVPTPIQAAAIPPLLELRDVVGIAQTGTGKTAAFGLPLLAIVDADERDVQALVLAPTRELAMQSAQAIEDFAARRSSWAPLAVSSTSSRRVLSTCRTCACWSWMRPTRCCAWASPRTSRRSPRARPTTA